MEKNVQRRKTGGRKKGVPNRTTAELRLILQSFLEVNLKTLQADFNNLEPRDRLLFLEKIAKLVLPPPPNEAIEPVEQKPEAGFFELARRHYSALNLIQKEN